MSRKGTLTTRSFIGIAGRMTRKNVHWEKRKTNGKRRKRQWQTTVGSSVRIAVMRWRLKCRTMCSSFHRPARIAAERWRRCEHGEVQGLQIFCSGLWQGLLSAERRTGVHESILSGSRRSVSDEKAARENAVLLFRFEDWKNGWWKKGSMIE